MLNQTELDVIRRLLQAEAEGNPLNVDGVAASIGISSPRASQLLRSLEQAGAVERRQATTPGGRAVFYTPRPWMEIQWSAPTEQVVLSWRSLSEPDWEFPLLSQLRDADARSTARTLLQGLKRLQLLDARKGEASGILKPKPDLCGATLVVYGSAARATATAGSDLDLLLFHGPLPARSVADIQRLSGGVSLHSARPIQLVTIDGDISRLPPGIGAAVREDGLLIYDGLRDPNGRSLGFWKAIYGGRSVGHA